MTNRDMIALVEDRIEGVRLLRDRLQKRLAELDE